jgi:starch phosphorylase
MDSLASVEVPALGYGIRYEFGIFDQVIRDGWQCEMTDKWLKNGNPWDIARSEIAYEVKFGGRTQAWADEQGRPRSLDSRDGGARRRMTRRRQRPRWHLQYAAP